MAATTLAIGSSEYQLLDLVNGVQTNSNKARVVGPVQALSVQALGGGTLENFGIGPASSNDGTNINNLLNVRATLENFKADLGAGSDTLNIVGNVVGASIEMDDADPPLSNNNNGNDLLTIAGSLKDDPFASVRSQIFTGGGNDTVRIGGNVETADLHLGSGNDSLLISGAVDKVYVGADDGNDFVEFRGRASDVIVQAGAGNDTVIFRDYLFGNYRNINQAGVGSLVAAVELGAGNDSLILGNGAENANVNSGSGSDTLRLSGFFENVVFTNEAGGDLITATANSSFSQTTFSSASSTGDTLVVGASSSFTDTNFYLGSGNDNLIFGYSSFNRVLFSTGGGSDTLVFGSNASFIDTTIDLRDNSADFIYFADNQNLVGLTVLGDAGDRLYIGSSLYQYGTPSGTANALGTNEWMKNWFTTQVS